MEDYYTEKETVGRSQILDNFLYNGLSAIRIFRWKSKFAHLEKHLSKLSLKAKFQNKNYLFYCAIKLLFNMIIEFYRTFCIIMKCLNFIALTWILVWKTSVKLSIMTERRQRQGFVFFINNLFPFSLMNGICS